MSLRRIVIFFFFLVSLTPLFGQKITISFSSPQSVKGVKLSATSYKDSSTAVKSLQFFLVELHQKGYLEAAIDTVLKSGTNWTAVLYLGKVYKYATIDRGSLPLPLANKVGFSAKKFRGGAFNIGEIYRLERRIIKIAENSGYPFASIGLDSIQFDDQNRLHTSFKYVAGPFITIDSLAIVGNYEVKYKFFQRLIRIKKKDEFSQLKINQSNNILKELPYVQVMAPPEAYIANGTTRITYFLEKRKANLIDGYVGFLPNAAKNNKLLVTGDLKLELKNLFRSGKTFIVNWQRFNEQSQYFKVYYEHPRIFGAGLDLGGLLEITRQDTSFLNINREMKASQQLGLVGKLDLFIGLKTGRVLSQRSNTDKLKLAYGDFNNYTYGVGYSLNKLDNFFYPKRGVYFTTKVFLGNKTILQNPFYSDATYVNVKKKTYQLNVEAMIEKYVSVSKRNVILTRLKYGQVFNDKGSLFLNDFYRIGGLKTLRGFNENQFYVSQFGIASLEYRFQTDEESYLLLFTDQAFIANPFVDKGNAEYLFALGAGISFTTPAGVFNFVYSVGQSSTQKLSLTLSKIHFGLVSKF